MTEILKASAGSGKTYNLARKYISLLLGSGEPDAYRHILAVTFTNKATAEMKGRILKELDTLARTPSKSPYLADLIRETGKDAAEIQKRSSWYLRAILHDYSSFSVSTIDKFFQQALKAFTREIGFFSSYQVELDRDSLVGEAVDRILDTLPSRGEELVRWVNDNMADRLAVGDRFKLDASLQETASRLLSERFDEAARAAGIDPRTAFSQENLRTIRAACGRIIDDFRARLRTAAGDLVGKLQGRAASQLEPYLKKYSSTEKIPYPKTKTLLKEAAGTPFAFLLDGDPYKVYLTAFNIREQTYALGFARDFRAEMEQLLREKNVLSLDDSNALLRRIIDGSDAPFIYEKMGVRYRHFLLDEFQDTSCVQWENMLPLLRETAAGGGTNFVVGDVKQSIYRWRDSDWRLLASEVESQLPDCAPPVALRGNWRSAREVVDFNNGFFRSVASRLGIEEIYSDVEQKACSDEEQPGCVEVVFVEGLKGRKNPPAENAAVLAAVEKALAAGALPSDIAVLVRTHNVGNRIADFLLENGHAVVSDDSLNVKNAESVTCVMARLSLILNAEDELARYILGDLEIPVPSGCESLVSLVEGIVRAALELRPEWRGTETQYLFSLLDIVQEWSATNGNDLAGFLEYWDSKSDFEISSPDDVQAIRIMTVHKSKGLEFPCVIVTDAEDYEVKTSKWAWCAPDMRDGLLPQELASAVYPVPFSDSETPHTRFSEAYDEEYNLSKIDMANLFYVALTRARKSLTIISILPSAEMRKACKAERETGVAASDLTKMQEFLYFYLGGEGPWQLGEPYDYSRLARPARQERRLEALYESIPLGGRLTPSADAADYFGADGAVGADASPRLAGIELHALLSTVNRLSDLPVPSERHDLASSVSSAPISPSERHDSAQNVSFAGADLLRERVAAHPEWFDDCPPGTAFNETEIIDTDGNVYRPDRVIVRDGAVTVIDYKFGAPRPAYAAQARRYARLYRDMGYERVRAFLWYVYEDRIEEITIV